MTSLARLFPLWAAASVIAACSRSSEGTPQTSADTEEAAPPSASMAPAGGADEPSEGMLPGSLGPPECDACLEDRCGDVVAACTAAAACSSLLGCVTGCSSQTDPVACFGGCVEAADDPEEFSALLGCLAEQCASECGEL